MNDIMKQGQHERPKDRMTERTEERKHERTNWTHSRGRAPATNTRAPAPGEAQLLRFPRAILRVHFPDDFASSRVK